MPPRSPVNGTAIPLCFVGVSLVVNTVLVTFQCPLPLWYSAAATAAGSVCATIGLYQLLFTRVLPGGDK